MTDTKKFLPKAQFVDADIETSVKVAKIFSKNYQRKSELKSNIRETFRDSLRSLKNVEMYNIIQCLHTVHLCLVLNNRGYNIKNHF
jgi:hypothetical protein